MGSVSTFIFVLFFLVVDIGTVLADGPPSYNQTYPWASPNPGQPSAICRCFPGDLCWPSDDTWQAFNTTLGGKLVKTVPLAAPCHDDTFTTYDAGQCQAIQAQWFEPQVHYESSSSIMAPYFTNYSCDPFLPRSAECVVGSYVEYSVNVTEPEDISKTIWFATYFNIRLVIRNTGHDYNGKSSGPGAIAIWTHHLKDIQFPDYASPSYTGKAVKAGAGVQAFEAYDAAAANQLQVVGGECPTVGLAGGYPQGGGHSSLSSKYGLAADQVLEWEVVDSTGAVLRAAPDENPDLFWALTGGGGGTYGVVTSMTSKAHADIPTSGANLTFTSAAITQDQFYDCVATFHNLLPTLVDAGAVAVWFITNQSFVLSPLTGPGIPSSFYPDALKPLTDQLSQLGVNYTSSYRDFPSFVSQYQTMQNPVAVNNVQLGGRFIPRSVVAANNTALTAAIRSINSQGAEFTGIGLNVNASVSSGANNSVNPEWRQTLIDATVVTPWNDTVPPEAMLAEQDVITNSAIPALATLTPGGGAYLNEGDFRQPDFQSVFYGANYEGLRAVKARYDPNDVFYAVTAVGSEEWVQRGDGRLCRA